MKRKKKTENENSFSFSENTLESKILDFEERKKDEIEIDWIENLTIDLIKKRKIIDKNFSKKKLYIHVFFPSQPSCSSHSSLTISSNEIVPNFSFQTDNPISIMVDDLFQDNLSTNPKLEPFENFSSYV